MINLFNMIAGGLTSGAINSFTGPLFSVVSSTVDAALLPAKYKAMGKYATLLPGPDALFNSWLHGETDLEQLSKILAAHNIPLNTVNAGQWSRTADTWWKAVFNASVPRMSIEQLLYCYYSGIMKPDDWQSILSKYKFRNDQEQLLKEMMYGKFDQQSIFTSYYRGIWDKVDTIKRIRRLYGVGEEHAEDILSTSQYIPTPQDLIRFAVRDVFNKDPKITDPLKEEYDENPDMEDWFNSQGMGEVIINPGKANEKKMNVPLSEWMAHWILPSPTQAYEMQHRLRPNRIDRYMDGNPDLVPFETGDLRQLLKQADYAKKYRPWLQAISYSVPRLIDIKNMFYKEIIDDKELKEKLLDRGNSPADANEIVEYYKKDKKDKDDKEKDKKLAKAYGRFKTAILHAYKQGSIGRGTALNGLLLTDMEVDEANIVLDAIDIEVNSARVDTYVKMVKREFYLGLYDGIDAYTQLITAGLDGNRASQYIMQWQREMSMPRKIASTDKLVKWYSQGFISHENLLSRLEKLGWTNADTILYMAEAENALQANRARIAAQQARDIRQREQAAKQLVREARTARREQITDFYRHSPPSDMKEWVKKGLLTPEDAYERLITFMGWTDEDATRWVQSLTGKAETNGKH